MGRVVELSGGERLSLRAQLEWHLQYNHYPPVSADFVDSAIESIQSINEEEPDKKVKLPNSKVLTALEICEGLHLESFVNISILGCQDGML